VADLSGPERATATERLLRWYLRTVDAAATAVSPHRYNVPLGGAEPDQPALRFSGGDEALRWYDSERVNVVAATRQASASGLHEVAWRLPAPLFSLVNRRGNWADCIATHHIALASARQAGNRQGEAWVLNNLGEVLVLTRSTEGIGYLEQALAVRREIGDRLGEAQAANNLADAYQRLGRTAEAPDLLRRALDLNRETGNSYGEGVTLGNLGAVLLDLDRAEEAIDYLQQARRVFAEIEYVDGLGYVLHILGRCYSSLCREAEAMTCLQQALASHRATGNRHRQAATLKSLGAAQSRAGLVAEAQESWARAAVIFDDLGASEQAAEVRAERVASGIS
jgi:tetratricopeptide (TPR) repeat protein